MTAVTIRRNAGEGERFARTAFVKSVLAGRTVPVRFGGQEVGAAVLLSAEVADDGSHALLTFDMKIEQPTPPCQCMQSWAAVSPSHEGHCCFAAGSACHADEMEVWKARKAMLDR